MYIYIVEENDTIDKIATEYGVTAEKIAFSNQLSYPYPLVIGQALLIPGGSREKERELVAGGYAYPFISRWVLEQTLPYLTELSVFSYGFTLEGDLVYPQPSDTWLLPLARQNKTRPILTLTPMNENGFFDNNLISELIQNEQKQGKLFNQLLQTLSERGYVGVNIDFEYIKAEDRDLFTEFFAKLAQLLHGEGYSVSIALAPKTSDNQPGLLYEGKDYAALGAIADTALLMTYEWGYK